MTKQVQSLHNVTSEQVRDFWNSNPLCASGIPHPLGSKEYFEYYNILREKNESIEFSYRLHEYKDFKAKKVLDVGSGNGYVLSKYATEGADVFGVDITPTAIDLCNKRFEYLGLEGNFQVADAQDLPFDNNFFDCVCSMGVLHHVPDTSKAVAEIFRVLKPGGRLIVMFYYRHSAKYQWRFRTRSWFKSKSMQQLVNEVDGVGNPKGEVFSKSELASTLTEFTDLHMFVDCLDSRDIFLRLGRIVPDSACKPMAPLLGWFLYAKARKP